MGWASGGEIFNEVAATMLRCREDGSVQDQAVVAVLSQLAGSLRSGDWDTVDELLAEFWDEPMIREVLFKADSTQHMYCDRGDYVGYLEFAPGGDQEGDAWSLSCSQHGELGTKPADSWESHDDLVRAWVEHDKSQHGGDGVVSARDLIVFPTNGEE